MLRIGEKLRLIRKQKKITLMELSQKTGVDTATLSRIERNIMPGTLQSHLDICKALDMPITQLYGELEAEQKIVEVIPKSGRGELFTSTQKNKFSYEILASNILQKKMMPVLIKLYTNGVTQVEQTPNGTEKFCYCTEGKIELVLGDKKYELKKGDALYFDGSISHFIKNLYKSESACVCVVSPPFL